MACRNVGTADRAVRVIAAVAFFALGFGVFGAAKGAPLGLVACAAGVVLLITALARFCPAYLPFGVRTCPRE